MKRKVRETEQFLQRQISKMYNERAPEYLLECQPGNAHVRCKALIQQIKDDTTTVGIAGEECLANIVMYYKELMKKKDKKERKQKRRDLMKQMDKDITKLIKYLTESHGGQMKGGPRVANADVDLSIELDQLNIIEEMAIDKKDIRRQSTEGI